jgi:hypothetical protein
MDEDASMSDHIDPTGATGGPPSPELTGSRFVEEASNHTDPTGAASGPAPPSPPSPRELTGATGGTEVTPPGQEFPSSTFAIEEACAQSGNVTPPPPLSTGEHANNGYHGLRGVNKTPGGRFRKACVNL